MRNNAELSFKVFIVSEKTYLSWPPPLIFHLPPCGNQRQCAPCLKSWSYDTKSAVSHHQPRHSRLGAQLWNENKTHWGTHGFLPSLMRNSLGSEAFHLLKESGQVDHHTVSHYAGHSLVQNAWGHLLIEDTSGVKKESGAKNGSWIERDTKWNANFLPFTTTVCPGFDAKI